MPSHHVLPARAGQLRQNAGLLSHLLEPGSHLVRQWIDAYIAKYGFLCQGNIDITRSYDLVDLWNTFRSECQGCDRLCTAHFIDLVDSGFFCGYQCGRIDFTVFSRRCCHNDQFYTRNLCRDQCSSARKMDKLPFHPVHRRRLFQRSDFLSEDDPGVLESNQEY